MWSFIVSQYLHMRQTAPTWAAGAEAPVHAPASICTGSPSVVRTCALPGPRLRMPWAFLKMQKGRQCSRSHWRVLVGLACMALVVGLWRVQPGPLGVPFLWSPSPAAARPPLAATATQPTGARTRTALQHPKPRASVSVPHHKASGVGSAEAEAAGGALQGPRPEVHVPRDPIARPERVAATLSGVGVRKE